MGICLTRVRRLAYRKLGVLRHRRLLEFPDVGPGADNALR